MTHSEVDKVPAYVAMRRASWVRTTQNGQSSKISCRFLRTGFRCSERRQYSGSMLWDMGIISSLIIGRSHYRVAGSSDRLSTSLTIQIMQIMSIT